MFIKLFVLKINDVEIELILEIIGDRNNDSDDESNGDVSNYLAVKMDEDMVKMEPEDDDNKDSFYLNYQPETQAVETVFNNQLTSEHSGEEPQRTVNDILEDVSNLGTVDKLILYQKLPNFRSHNADTYLQPPSAPQGSNSQTIIWMKNHLQEDPQGNIPKQDVYDDYVAYCHANSIKQLSTTDFGKVMKQVFPHVHPRRLGTRGKSRYCYSGIRKIFIPPMGGRFLDSCLPTNLALEAPQHRAHVLCVGV